MHLQMGRVTHRRLWRTGRSGQRGEDVVEDPHSAPADEAIVQRLVRAVGGGRITPAQAVLEDEDDATDAAAIIDARHSMSQRKNTAISDASAPSKERTNRP